MLRRKVKRMCYVFAILFILSLFVYALLYNYVSPWNKINFATDDGLCIHWTFAKKRTIDLQKHKIPLFSEVKKKKLERNIYTEYSTGYQLRLESRRSINCNETTFAILGNRTIHLGDFFSVIITAKDENGRPQEQGGDFWFATISNPELKARSAGKIIDYDNGTYEVVFLASFIGNVKIEIVLVAQKEAVEWLREVFWPAEQKLKWVGYFSDRSPGLESKKSSKENEKIESNESSTTNEKTETSFCYFQGGLQWDDKCEFRHASGLGSIGFTCDKPATLECDSLKTIKIDVHHVTWITKSLIEGKEYIFNSSYQNLTNGPNTIIIIEKEAMISTTEAVTCKRLPPDFFKLPACLPDQPEPLTEGYWVGEEWINLRCKTKTKQWSKKEIKTCFRKKKLYLMGDSTTRQWLEVLAKYLGYKYDKNYWVTKIVAKKGNTLDAFFQFYPFAVTKKNVSFSDVKFESDLLQSLPETGCEYFIVISPWAHYTQWKQSDYRKRLELLRNAILRFKYKCPNTPIVIKGSHARHHNSSLESIYSSDYTLFMIGKTMENVFDGIGVHFMDVWDMNLAYSSVRNVHMPSAVIVQELNMFFSLVCK